MLPDPDWKAEDQPGLVGATRTRITMMTRVVIYLLGCLTRRRQKKPAQPKENDDHARPNVKVKEGAAEEEFVAGPVVTRAQAKKGDKVHQLKVTEAMSSVYKTTFENLQKKDLTLKKCFDCIGKRIIRENYVGGFYKKHGLLYGKHHKMKTGQSLSQLGVPKEL